MTADVTTFTIDTDSPIFQAVREAKEAVPGLLAGFGTGVNALKPIGTMFTSRGFRYVREQTLWFADADFHVGSAIQTLANECPEHAHLVGIPFDVWFWCRPIINGRTIRRGVAGAVSAKRRALWPTPPAPWFSMGLCLPYWLLATEEQRLRLVHHEMGHCGIDYAADGEAKPITDPHDTEEFMSTMGRFGPANDTQAALIVNATQRDDWPGWQRSVDDRQGVLFPAWKGAS